MPVWQHNETCSSLNVIYEERIADRAMFCTVGRRITAIPQRQCRESDCFRYVAKQLKRLCHLYLKHKHVMNSGKTLSIRSKLDTCVCCWNYIALHVKCVPWGCWDECLQKIEIVCVCCYNYELSWRVHEQLPWSSMKTCRTSPSSMASRAKNWTKCVRCLHCYYRVFRTIAQQLI